MVPDSAASMLNPRSDEAPNLGGSTRVNGEAVFLLFKIPIRFRVGERPAGAVKGVDLETVVLSLGAGERAGRIGRRGEERVGLRAPEKSLGDGGALVRKKLMGFWRSMLEPSGDLSFLGERKCVGSMFSESESSKEEALRLVGEESVEIAF